MTPEIYEGLPFFIGTGTKVNKDILPNVQNAIQARCRDITQWRDRLYKGEEVRKAIIARTSGAVQNVNMTFAYNAYFKFLHQSLLSLRDSFRISSNDYTVDVERPKTILKSYLDALQEQNDLLIDDAIIYGCAATVMDVNLETKTPEPQILLNRVESKAIFYDFEQPGAGMFTIRITPELAYKYTFLEEYRRMQLYNKAIASADCVAHIRVFIGELVVDGKLDNYVALIYQRQVIYAEKGRDLTVLRAVSINDKNFDCSPLYTVLKATEISQDVYKLLFDYNEEMVNPIRACTFKMDANVWEEAKKTRFLKMPLAGQTVTPLLPGNLDINGLVNIQQSIQVLSQQAAGLNDYTLGESQGSVRTAAEAMMLADSASGILNILANKLKSQLILPMLEDILEILKIALQDVTDIFPDSLYIDTDIAKDQQEANMLMSLINMPMFGAVIQGLDSIQALQLFRWILEKLHISGTSSVFDSLIDNAISNPNQSNTTNNINNNNNNTGVQR